MNKNMAAKLSSLPCFEAFSAICCPHFCSYSCLVCGGGGGHSRVSELRGPLKSTLALTIETDFYSRLTISILEGNLSECFQALGRVHAKGVTQ